MYEEDSLHQYEYRLHAVMVHEGGVDSGHYWAYVQDHRDDITFGSVTWNLHMIAFMILT